MLLLLGGIEPAASSRLASTLGAAFAGTFNYGFRVKKLELLRGFGIESTPFSPDQLEQRSWHVSAK
jgi:hypothetical protein